MISSDVNPYLYQCPVFEDWHDPLAVRRQLFIGSEFKFNEWLEQQRSKDAATAMLAHEKLIPLVRKVFKLPAVDAGRGTGVADQQVLDVLQAFLNWLDAQGKA